MDEDNSIKDLSLLQELGTTSNGCDVMKIINDYFEKYNVMWEILTDVCTDGAPVMLRSRSGLVTLVKEKKPFNIDNGLYNSSTSITALASKTLPKDLLYTVNQIVRIVNVIKSSALNTCIFKFLYRHCSQLIKQTKSDLDIGV